MSPATSATTAHSFVQTAFKEEKIDSNEITFWLNDDEGESKAAFGGRFDFQKEAGALSYRHNLIKSQSSWWTLNLRDF